MSAPPTLFLPDEDATLQAGRCLAAHLKGNELITLSGNLGAGKTTFSRGLIRALGHQGAVKSPTFTLVEPYQIGILNIAHFDLYRLGDPEELEFLGIRDYLDGSTLCLVEWPEKAGRWLPTPDLALTISLNAPRGRILSWTHGSPAGSVLSEALTTLSSQSLQ